MILPDINILVYAHRSDSAFHKEAKTAIEDLANSLAPFALSSFVCSGFLRIVTHHRIFNETSSLKEALSFIEILLGSEQCRLVEPQNRHWEIFSALLKKSNATANLISDAYLAAIAIENGCTLLTRDSDFRIFPELVLKFLN